ncbi:DUF6151 family protein [Jannaschia aquimarina]|uniref:CENP-V/GFA domain-containing protein n=1 Tax=Jannaschia aquimarina TaxID=935700 RepID=A0A0D1EKD3_9RHOB|nr:DUF6151 family protein [Jannaschia aquimarina]KIT18044.1 hypothetical protein jaqu_01690 [Jannaschia aquimarina]SNS89157.1 hypothetical protein SAMN05421775_103194 [Jannaschia aquimarina]
MPDLPFACRCGRLRGHLSDMDPSAYTHIVCHCDDCRAAYTHLGMADPEKVGIVQTSQDQVHIDEGGENLRVFRHTAKGALRWYATCCDTPLFYTPLKARLVHVGVNADRVDGDLGPVRAEGFVPTGSGHRHKGALRMVGRMATRMAAKNLNGQWRETPFFDDEGAPAVPPQVLTREQRAAALMGVRQS